MACSKNRRIRVGKAGENIAAGFLIKAGHTILERNWRSGHLEIDLITLAGDGIHFVEVKSRVFPMEAGPEENVGYAKRKNMAAAARKWMKTAGKDDLECRFDVISVVFKDGTYEIEYLPEAFIPIFV